MRLVLGINASFQLLNVSDGNEKWALIEIFKCLMICLEICLREPYSTINQKIITVKLFELSRLNANGNSLSVYEK